MEGKRLILDPQPEGPLILRSLQGPFCQGIWDMVKQVRMGGWAEMSQVSS